jgi:hypothetical protein
VLTGLAAALSVVAAWTHTLVSDTDAFVATYAPVVRSEAVQQVLSTRLTDAILTQLGADNRLVRPLVTRVVTEAVGSDLLDSATTASLRLAHGELVSLLTDDPGRLQVADGQVQLRFAPFVDPIRQRLSSAGVPFVDRLPEVTGGITLFTIDPQVLPAAQAGYRGLEALAGWLPWLAVLLAATTLWAWPGVRRPLIALGVSAVVWVSVLGLGWQLAMDRLGHAVGADLASVAGTVAGVTAMPVASPLLAIGVSGAVLAAIALLVPADPARRGPSGR